MEQFGFPLPIPWACLLASMFIFFYQEFLFLSKKKRACFPRRSCVQASRSQGGDRKVIFCITLSARLPGGMFRMTNKVAIDPWQKCLPLRLLWNVFLFQKFYISVLSWDYYYSFILFSCYLLAVGFPASSSNSDSSQQQVQQVTSVVHKWFPTPGFSACPFDFIACYLLVFKLRG